MRYLLLIAIAMILCIPSVAYAQHWTVTVVAPVDSEIQQVMDSATIEPAMCLGVTVDHATHTILVWQMLPAVRIGRRQTRDMISFGCPEGAALSHGHFLAREHEDGPSDYDVAAIRDLPKNERPPAALIVVADARRAIHYVPYAVQ